MDNRRETNRTFAQTAPSLLMSASLISSLNSR